MLSPDRERAGKPLWINMQSVKKTLIKALPRQGESEKTMDFQHVKSEALMLI